MSNEILLTMEQVGNLLKQQKINTGKHITRNLTEYSWYSERSTLVSVDVYKEELRQACQNAEFPEEFLILKKYTNK